MLPRTTNNRAELTAVLEGLGKLRGPCTVHLVCDSRYVVDGISLHLNRWRRQSWRAGGGKHKRDLQNADLWQRIDELLRPHRVSCEWVRSHSGDPANEHCDRLAAKGLRRAMARRKSRRVSIPG
jgi:ribonuclease HI